MAQTFVLQYPRSSLAPSVTHSTITSGRISPPLSTPSLSDGSTTTSSTSIDSSRSAHPLHYYDMHDLSTSDRAPSFDGEALPTQHPDPVLLPCALRFLPCSFASDDEEEWRMHSLSHFHPFGPPPRTSCPLCPLSFSPENPSLAWHSRMNHMLVHHRDSLTHTTAQADFSTYEYMWKKGLLKDAQLKEIKGNARYGEKMEEEPVTYTLSASAGRDERHRRRNGRGARQSIRQF